MNASLGVLTAVNRGWDLSLEGKRPRLAAVTLIYSAGRATATCQRNSAETSGAWTPCHRCHCPRLSPRGACRPAPGPSWNWCQEPAGECALVSARSDQKSPGVRGQFEMVIAKATLAPHVSWDPAAGHGPSPSGDTRPVASHEAQWRLSGTRATSVPAASRCIAPDL